MAKTVAFKFNEFLVCIVTQLLCKDSVTLSNVSTTCLAAQKKNPC